MHAVVIRVTLKDRDAAEGMLREQIVPTVSQAPGFVAGYWSNLDGEHGASMIVFESEDAAASMAERIGQDPPEFVALDSIDVAEVVAHA
jgi:hypothetical protein